jgi:CheY-like chemotaxis protein
MGFAHKIGVAMNGAEALNYLDCKEQFVDRDCDCTCPDLILLDLNMPVMNGFDFLELYEARNNPEKEQVKLYVLTSSSHSLDHFKISLFKSVTGYLTKPLTEEVLLGLVE